MLIVMKAGASRADVAAVEDKSAALGFTPNEIPGSTRLAIGITGNQGPLDPGMFTVMPVWPTPCRFRRPGSSSRAR